MRRTVTELPGKAWRNVVPSRAMLFVTGATFLGSANEFSSVGLAEASRIWVALSGNGRQPFQIDFGAQFVR